MYFKNNDLSFYYDKEGNGKSNVIILPGWGDTRKTFQFLINNIKAIATVYSLDYPGFGNSNFPNKDLTIYDYTLLVKDFIETEEIDNPIIIGHSFGGRIIITLLGYYHYKCDKIILIDSAGIKDNIKLKQKIKTTTYKLLKKVSGILPKNIKTKYLEKLFNYFGSTDYKHLPSNMMQTFSNIVKEDLKPYLKDIEASTLIIWGEEDKVTPLSDGKKIESLIPDSALITVKNTGHFPYLDKPNYIWQIILAFISS
ncbi:MAG: alpha/beta hydrolase [Bacilli bacterium]